MARRIAIATLLWSVPRIQCLAFSYNPSKSGPRQSLRRVTVTQLYSTSEEQHQEQDFLPTGEYYTSDSKQGTLNGDPTITTPLSMTIEELAKAVGGKGRAQAIWDCYRIGVDPLFYYNPIQVGLIDRCVSDMYDTDISTTSLSDIQNHFPSKRRTERLGWKALSNLASLYNRGTRSGSIEKTIASVSHITTSADGTIKLLIRLAEDGMQVETVIIPWPERGRSTLCVSSQVGCRQGCTFCATGRMGKLRSLSSDEILCQVYYSRKICRVMNIPTVENVVFMGMGEPADNAEAVVRAAIILADRRLFQMAQSKVTISTVGPSPESFLALGAAPAVLAWSVHASRDGLRRKLVPTTRHTMVELRKGFVSALLLRSKKLRTTMLEVALMEGVNDDVKEAEHLATFALEMLDMVPGMKLVVNLIPYNDIGSGSSYCKPSLERVRAFQNTLLKMGVTAYVRTTRGDDESAACGQLATKKTKATFVDDSAISAFT